jgi:glycolate oxidase
MVGGERGGPHTLVYGVTTNHVLGLEAVLPDGSVSMREARGRMRRATT